MMWKKVISMLLVAAMLAMPIGCGKDGNKDKDTTSGVETTDIGDDSAETDAPSKTPVPKEDKETKESDKDTDTENETDFSDDDYEPAQVTKKEYESMSAQDLIDRIKDVKNITEDEALALYSTYAYTNYTEDFYGREENITDEAFKILKDNGCKIPYTTTIRDNMLHSENANVRAYAFTTIGGLFGTSSEEEKMAEEVLAKETEPVVLFAALRSLGGAVSNPAVAEFVLNMTEHENANVRKQAALAIGSEWAMGIDGMVDAILKLMGDEDEEVRTCAYKYAGRLHDDRVIDPLEEVLKDSSLVRFHDACITSLTYMWYDYPSHRYSENYLRSCIGDAIYNETESDELMDYGIGNITLKKVVNTEDITKIKVKVCASETYLPDRRNPYTKKVKQTLIMQRARYPERRREDGVFFMEKECPSCGANFVPDENHCCSFCGYSLKSDNAKWILVK